MAREPIEATLNLDDLTVKQQLRAQIGVLTGVWEVKLTPRRKTRTNQQNAWYHGCICKALADYMTAQDWEVTTPKIAHQILSARFLAHTLVDPKTGEELHDENGRPIRYVRSTTSLSTVEFAEYCERCRAFLAQYRIVVDDPDPCWAMRKPEVACHE